MKPSAATTNERLIPVYEDDPDVCRYCGRQRGYLAELEQCIVRGLAWPDFWPRHYWIPVPRVTTNARAREVNIGY